MKLIGLFACLSVAWPMGAYADRCQTDLPVSATVVPTAVLSATAVPGVVTVTDADLRRGHKTLPLRYELRGNSPAGYLLHIDPRVGASAGVDVRGLSRPVRVARQRVTVALDTRDGTRELDLHVRWRFNADTVPGTYPLPVRLSVTPLAQD